MAWSAPKTWVDQETPSADDFNTEIRDNLDALSTHSHTGAAGDGSATLGSVDYIDLDEGGALSEPASNHTRFAANTNGTLRYRANGGTEKTVSDTTHTHTIASSTETKTNSTASTGNSGSYGNSVGVTFTPSDSTGTQHYATVHFGASEFQNANGQTGTFYQRLLKAGVEQSEKQVDTTATVNEEKIINDSIVYVEPANSSTTFNIESKQSGSVLSNVIHRSVITREVRCQ